MATEPRSLADSPRFLRDVLADAVHDTTKMRIRMEHAARALLDAMVELQRLRVDRDFLTEQLKLANLKLERLRPKARPQVFPSSLPALLRPQAE